MDVNANGFTKEHGERRFFQSLAETIAWCQRFASTSDVQRSLRQLEYTQNRAGLLDTPSHRVFSLSIERSRELGKRFPDLKFPERTSLQGGRLLVFPPEDTMSDGFAEAESNGFFDMDNCPPCDTWVTYCRGTGAKRDGNDFLLSWLPPQFIERVQRGIDGNPEECIFWLDDLDHPIVTDLRRRGMLP